MRVRVYLLLSSLLCVALKTTLGNTHMFLVWITKLKVKIRSSKGHHQVTSRTLQGHLILKCMLLFTHNQFFSSNVIIKCFVGKMMIISPIWQIDINSNNKNIHKARRMLHPIIEYSSNSSEALYRVYDKLTFNPSNT